MMQVEVSLARKNAHACSRAAHALLVGPVKCWYVCWDCLIRLEPWSHFSTIESSSLVERAPYLKYAQRPKKPCPTGC